MIPLQCTRSQYDFNGILFSKWNTLSDCCPGGSTWLVSADPGTAAVRGNATEDLSDCSTGLMLVIRTENVLQLWHLYIFFYVFHQTPSVIYKPTGIIVYFFTLNKCTVSYYFLTVFFKYKICTLFWLFEHSYSLASYHTRFKTLFMRCHTSTTYISSAMPSWCSETTTKFGFLCSCL